MKSKSLATTASVMLFMPLFLIACAQPSSHAGGNDDNDAMVNRNIDDAFITARIKSTFLFNPYLTSLSINVDTKGGVATLQGVVRSDVQRDLAEEIASKIDGVTLVNNRLELSDDAVGVPDETDHTFSQEVIDATTTASVKTRLAVKEVEHQIEIRS